MGGVPVDGSVLKNAEASYAVGSSGFVGEREAQITVRTTQVKPSVEDSSVDAGCMGTFHQGCAVDTPSLKQLHPTIELTVGRGGTRDGNLPTQRISKPALLPPVTLPDIGGTHGHAMSTCARVPVDESVLEPLPVPDTIRVEVHRFGRLHQPAEQSTQ